MLNKDGQRELVYTVTVDDIQPIPGKDRVECAVVGGWTIMVRKDQFKPGDRAIYFEIDSKVPEKEPFMFLEGKHFKIKTQGYRNPDGSKFYSQGLLMGIEDFNGELDWILEKDTTDTIFLTKELGVTYYDPEDDKRKRNKTNPDAKYQRMMNRHPKLAKSKFGRWCMKHKLAKKLLYLILGGDKKNGVKNFPAWVKVTDEERYQNLPQNLYDEYCKEEFWATEKIDGCSSTFTMKGFGKDRQYLVCSRQIVKDIKDPKGGYYEENVWAEINEKYNMRHVCESILDKMKDELEFITLQGEIYGKKIQKREYGLTDRDLALFNIIFGYKDGTIKRLNPVEGANFIKEYEVPYVPILGKMTLPDDREQMQDIAKGKSMIDGKEREGIVFRSEDGTKSFKAVDNEFLLKYHG